MPLLRTPHVARLLTGRSSRTVPLGEGIGAWGLGIGISGIRDYENAIRTERGDLAGPAGAEPGAQARAAVVLVRPFVDDGVGGGRLDDRLPGTVGPARDVLQRLGQHAVLRRRAAAVAVDERLPVQRGVEHVAHVEGRLAERELDENGRRRQLRGEAIDLGRRRSDGQRSRKRREPALRVPCGVLVDRNGDRDRFEQDQRSGDGGHAPLMAAVDRRDADCGQCRKPECHDRGVAGGHPEAVETRHQVVEHGVDVARRHHTPLRMDLRAERHDDGKQRDC